MNFDREVACIFDVYTSLNIPLPKPRAMALRCLEEAVELALECGASVRDINSSVAGALRNEHDKDPGREYEAERVGSAEAIAGEIADVYLLATATSILAKCEEDVIGFASIAKVERLSKAAKTGTLHFTPDGRFYRRARTPL